MLHTTPIHGIPAGASMTSIDVAAVLACGRALQRDANSGATRALLRGRKIGLLGDTAHADEAELFCRAASGLGAQVAHIRTSLSEQSTLLEIRRTARMLGLLYDAIECQGMATDLVRLIGLEAGVPVFDALASPRHPSARLGLLIDGAPAGGDHRCYVLQAVLLGSLA